MMSDFVRWFELKSNSIIHLSVRYRAPSMTLTFQDSIASLLGFRNVVYTNNATHEFENTVNIMKINCIKIEV